ncbi:unnamed protein product [Nesidiocoris tenuis]|uniref:Uncharacterized protein n=1 Tax=Nesidiocoris tenuis TaxID=355587 RepID=A0A6H5G2F7_9HEMI|nr:unnamed protein product [Nesidiocoris tenuis]
MFFQACRIRGFFYSGNQTYLFELQTAATMRALSMVPRAYRPYGLEGGGGGNRSEENEEDSPTHNTRTRFRYCLLLQDRDTHTGKRRSGSAEGENGRSWARTATEAAEPEQPRRRRAGRKSEAGKSELPLDPSHHPVAHFYPTISVSSRHPSTGFSRSDFQYATRARRLSLPANTYCFYRE